MAKDKINESPSVNKPKIPKWLQLVIAIVLTIIVLGVPVVLLVLYWDKTPDNYTSLIKDAAPCLAAYIVLVIGIVTICTMVIKTGMLIHKTLFVRTKDQKEGAHGNIDFLLINCFALLIMLVGAWLFGDALDKFLNINLFLNDEEPVGNLCIALGYFVVFIAIFRIVQALLMLTLPLFDRKNAAKSDNISGYIASIIELFMSFVLKSVEAIFKFINFVPNFFSALVDLVVDTEERDGEDESEENKK